MIEMNLLRDQPGIHREFKDRAWDETTGQSPQLLRENCEKIWNALPEESIQLRRARVITYLMDHGQLEVRPFECFADQVRHERILAQLSQDWHLQCQREIQEELNRTQPAVECRAMTGEQDFNHTCPDWRSLLTLGIPGILARLQCAREKAAPEQMDFFDSAIMVYQAMLRLLSRLADLAEKKAAETPRLLDMAENLRALCLHAPQTLYQALQLSTFAYFMQQGVEGALVRSLGRFDLLFSPFYEADLHQGRLTRAQAKELLQYYFYRWDALDITANIPITLCGRDEQGREVGGDFTRLILEAYGDLSIVSPKFHIRCSPGMADDILLQVLSLIRAGSSSFVFCHDEVVEAAMRGIGQSAMDARDYVMVGCYESTSMGREVACTCNGRVSFPKAVEYAMTGGVDLMTGQQIGLPVKANDETFDAFMESVRMQLCFLADQSMARISLIESLYPRVFSAPVFSGAMMACLESGKDVYAGGAKYNNSSINAFGIATAADALAAIRQLVFEEKRLSIREFSEILKNNWAGEEKLRLICLKRMPKYGVNNPAVDQLAADLMATVAHRINGAPNGRGGVFRTGAFSIDWRFDFGEHTAASADGRKAGETLSKNISATLGMDTQGVTALIQSGACFDGTLLPNGIVLDIVLHESAVAGGEGLAAMLGLLKTFLRAGGMALQCNVLQAETLRNAQAHPEKYPTLQVRLCGWNVLFINLSKKEQDELILQAESA